MARITVEQKALTDPRFRILGAELNPLTTPPKELIEMAWGLYLAIRVWDYAQERGQLIIDGIAAEGIYPGLADALIYADLAESVGKKKIRLKGGEGRLDWLEKKRQAGRLYGPKGKEYGKLGGRPPKPPDPVSENGVRGLEKNPPPAPAPAPPQKNLKSLPRKKRGGLFDADWNGIKDWAVKEWGKFHSGQTPTWGRAEYVSLTNAFKRLKKNENEFRKRWILFLEDEDRFIKDHNPKMFISRLDRWSEGAEPEDDLPEWKPPAP